MNATFNQTESTEFPLNDFWTRCKQAIDEMEEKIEGLVELTVVPFIVNVVCQILLLVIGTKPPSSCEQKMNQLSNLLEMNTNSLCNEANALVDTRKNKLHYQTFTQLEKDVNDCKRYFRIYSQELNSRLGNIERQIILKFDEIRSIFDD